jgi:DNA-directed RNA polymerase subunit beta
MTSTYKIFSSPTLVRDNVNEALVNALQASFPIVTKEYTLEVSNVEAHPKDFREEDEKKAFMESKSLIYPITGTLTLRSTPTGKVLDTVAKFPIMDAFHITPKHTLVYKGNNYVVASLLKLKPGVFVRTSDVDGHLEAHFNTKKGANFKVLLTPQTGLFSLETSGGAAIPLIPLLTHVFGVTSTEAEKYIPASIWKENVTATAGKEDKIIDRFYNRLVYDKKSNTTLEEKLSALKEALSKGTLDEETTKETLGKALSGISGETLLLTLKKMIGIYRGDLPEDNRDSLQFKKVSNLPDFLRERFDKNHESVRGVKKRLRFALEKLDPSSPSIRSVITPKPFNKVYSSYIQNSSLVSTPSETNPLESLENVGKVTVLGPEEGGIGDERAVPLAARNIDLSHIGILDPARTPESGHAGIDLRFTVAARRDKDGNLYTEVQNRQGKNEVVSVSTLMHSIVGFKGSEKDGKVQAKANNELRSVPIKDVDYWIADPSNLYTVTTNLVPFLNSNHPGRLTMAGKALPQALSLVNREAPLVQTVKGKKDTFAQFYGRFLATASPVDGVVTKTTPTAVHIQSDDGKTHIIKAVKDLPFNQKGFFDDEKPLVEVGQRVHAASPADPENTPTPLFENNYTKNGTLALGKNLTVAYMPWKGYNHEDGIVIREGAAKDLDSHHAYKFEYDVVSDTVPSKALVKRYFPSKFTQAQLNKLDDQGYVKPDAILETGDPIIAVLEKKVPSVEDRMLGRLHKILVTPYRLVTEVWDHAEKGRVVNTSTTTPTVKILVRSIKSLEIGDKLTGQHGNKGIVSLIVPDKDMPYDKETGKPVDLLLNPASVTSRINLGQVHETIAGKIAEKTGKPYLIRNFGNQDNVKQILSDLKANNLKDTSDLVDPKTGRTYNNILTGKQYILKLFKTTDQNYSARNVGGYDANSQPTKGGVEGAKSEGYMEALALMGSNARKNLKETTTLKSERNDEFWNKFLKGEALPKPKMTFATQKFFDMLKASGAQVQVKDGVVAASPMTNTEIMQMSHGEIETPKMLNSKNLEPEKGGLFDPRTTGGLKGMNWTHYSLAEPVVHPLLEKSVKTILGLTGTDFDKLNSGEYSVDPKTRAITDTKTGKLIKHV